jgi:hypothetical protein
MTMTGWACCLVFQCYPPCWCGVDMPPSTPNAFRQQNVTVEHVQHPALCDANIVAETCGEPRPLKALWKVPIYWPSSSPISLNRHVLYTSYIFLHPFRVSVQPSFHAMHQIFICRSMLQIEFHNVYDPVCSITDQAILVCEPPHFGWLKFLLHHWDRVCHIPKCSFQIHLQLTG